MINVFLLTFNEQDLWCQNYPKEFVEQHFKPANIHFIVLDNGRQPKMQAWCQEHGYTYYASEYNIGSAGGYNWIFKVAQGMGLTQAVLIQADVEMSNASPLVLTYNVTEQFGDTHFICWPQHLNNYWLDDHSQRTAWDHRIHNLGNIVGFKPRVMHDKDCYFDDNYVVTHFDDVEFLIHCRHTGKMKWINLPYMLGFHDQKYQPGPEHAEIFVINSPLFTVKIWHASQHIAKTRGLPDHSPWYTFNKPYYDQCAANDFQRGSYDPSRWQQHGYPPYPTEYEINRFFNQRPELKKENIEHRYL
jgi:hypothetical protein